MIMNIKLSNLLSFGKTSVRTLLIEVGSLVKRLVTTQTLGLKIPLLEWVTIGCKLEDNKALLHSWANLDKTCIEVNEESSSGVGINEGEAMGVIVGDSIGQWPSWRLGESLDDVSKGYYGPHISAHAFPI